MSRVAMTALELPGVRRFSPRDSAFVPAPLVADPIAAGLGEDDGVGDTDDPGGGGCACVCAWTDECPGAVLVVLPCNQLLRRADTGGVLCVNSPLWLCGGKCNLTV